MSICFQLSRFKKWSVLLFLLVVFGGVITTSSSFASCEYLSSSDFSSGSGWTVNDTTFWSIYDHSKLAASNLTSTSDYATRDFFPDDFFSADVDIDIVSSTEETDRVGVRIRSSGDVLFSVQGASGQITTNGVLCYYYPTTRLLTFKVFDMVAGEWVEPIETQSVSVGVNTIGLSMVADGVIFRINGQDTHYKLTGDFSFAPYVIDSLRLYAGGTGLHARFSNVCASPYEMGDFPSGNSMPMPYTHEVVNVTPAASPVTDIAPALANPFGFGPVASGGDILSLTAGISGLAAPADLYVGIGIGSEIYVFDSNNALHPISEGLVKWRANSTGGFNAVPLLPAGMDVSSIPGTYDFYFMMTPAGNFDAGYYLWVSRLVVSGGTSVITDPGMEAEVEQNINLIFGITSGFSGGLGEVMSIFQDQSVVTISPDLNSVVQAVFNGAPVPDITMTANFGSGHTMASGTVMSGSAQIVLSNIQFTSHVVGADFTGIINDVKKDGVPFVQGQLSGHILMTERPDEKHDVTGQVNITNLSISGQQLSGAVGVSGIIDHLDLSFLFNSGDDSDAALSGLLETTGDIRLAFSNFVSGANTINSGTVDISSAHSGAVNVTTNLQTNQGPVNLNMALATSTTGVVINTTAPGSAGPYTLSMNNVTLDTNTCANYPTAGTVTFTRPSTGRTGVVTFTGTCSNNSYRYSER